MHAICVAVADDDTEKKVDSKYSGRAPTVTLNADRLCTRLAINATVSLLQQLA